MDIHLTPAEAWADFWKWIKQQPNWKGKDGISRNEKQALYKANRASEGRDVHPLGVRRVKRILNHYAPGRYEFREVVVLHQDSADPDDWQTRLSQAPKGWEMSGEPPALSDEMIKALTGGK